VKAISQFKLIT